MRTPVLRAGVLVSSPSYFKTIIVRVCTKLPPDIRIMLLPFRFVKMTVHGIFRVLNAILFLLVCLLGREQTPTGRRGTRHAALLR
jgi:hypothetical protein